MAEDATSKPDLDLDDEIPEEITWPRPVGITSLVVGCLTVVCNGCNALSLAVQEWGKRMQEKSGQKAMVVPDVLQPSTVDNVVFALSVLLGLFLLVSGIVLIARKPVARALHLIYSASWLVLAAVGLVSGLGKLGPMAAYFKEHPDDPMAKFASPTGTLISIVLVYGLGVLWPGFCLVWFGFVKRTRRSMVGGGAA